MMSGQRIKLLRRQHVYSVLAFGYSVMLLMRMSQCQALVARVRSSNTSRPDSSTRA